MGDVYPFAKDRKEKINELQAITFDEESAGDAENCVAPPKQAKRIEDFSKLFTNFERHFARFGGARHF